MGYELNPAFPIESSSSERAAFIRRTYAHLAGAILGFVAIEALIFGVIRPSIEGFDQMVFGLLFGTPYSWLV